MDLVSQIKQKISKKSITPKELLYSETLTSNRTNALFIVLTGFFLALFTWHFTCCGADAFAYAFFFLGVIFFFYVLNYRTLGIQIDEKTLRFKFGIFSLVVPFINISECQLDALTALQKYGGAGIHFMLIGGRYRVFFNFLEYPRLVIRLKKAAGLVKDVSFSTRNPEQVISMLNQQIHSEQSNVGRSGKAGKI